MWGSDDLLWLVKVIFFVLLGWTLLVGFWVWLGVFLMGSLG